MNADELAEVLALHGKWRRGEIGGSRAYLTDAYLADADLAGAYLTDANLTDANLAGAYLTDANLTGANLTDANLAGAYLTDANLTDANLAGANLAGADLTDANLTDADLTGANLAGAYLTDANLTDANLAGANLTDANLTDADLAGANLAGADLAGANLAGANLAGADLAGANLAGANLADANLAGANLADAENVPPVDPAQTGGGVPAPGADRATVLAARAAAYRERHPEAPMVDRLDARILQAITLDGGTLDMGVWHSTSCKTAHCRAGWAITLAGAKGAELEQKYGPERAGRMIYRASTGRAPFFFASTERALEDIKACAAAQSTKTEEA